MAKEVKVENFTATEVDSNLIAVFQDDQMVFLATCDNPITEVELLKEIDSFIAFRKSGKVEDLLKAHAKRRDP